MAHELPHLADGLWVRENQFSSRVWLLLGPPHSSKPHCPICMSVQAAKTGYWDRLIVRGEKGVNLGKGEETGSGSGKSCRVVGVSMIKMHCMHA